MVDGGGAGVVVIGGLDVDGGLESVATCVDARL